MHTDDTRQGHADSRQVIRKPPRRQRVTPLALPYLKIPGAAKPERSISRWGRRLLLPFCNLLLSIQQGAGSRPDPQAAVKQPGLADCSRMKPIRFGGGRDAHPYGSSLIESNPFDSGAGCSNTTSIPCLLREQCQAKAGRF